MLRLVLVFSLVLISSTSSADLVSTLKKIKPSITKEVETWYEKIKEGASSIIPKEADKSFYG